MFKDEFKNQALTPNSVETIKDMDLPGLRLHELKGKRKGTWAVNVSGNWRVTFIIQRGDVFDVNYEDYH